MQFLIIHEADPRFTEKMPWTDNATFETNETVNRHNCVYQCDKNSHRVTEEEFNVPGAGIL
jgi:hypothetical protein